MTKKEIAEIKKRFNVNKCSVDRIAGCYVDGEKNIKTTFSRSFLAMPEEEMFKYFEIFKKSLSGSIGKNLSNLEFAIRNEGPGSNHQFLLDLRNSGLKDEALLDEFYQKVIESYDFVGNYLILLIHDVYDVPMKTSDNIMMDDSSDEVYDYILFALCPVTLSKPALSYDGEENAFITRIRDWIVEKPQSAFLFPAFNDRSADIHSCLFYTAKAEERPDGFVSSVFALELPSSANTQKVTFEALIEDTLKEDCNLDAIKAIHNKLTEMVEEKKEDPEPLMLDEHQVQLLLEESGASNEALSEFPELYKAVTKEGEDIAAGNIMSRNFEVKTPDVTIKVKPDRTDLIETRIINGVEYLLINLEGGASVNGITITKTLPDKDEE